MSGSREMAHVSWAQIEKRRERKKGPPPDTWKPRPDRFAHETLEPVFKLVEARKYQQARERVADMLERDPDHRRALSVLIMLHGKLDEIEYSEHLFQDAVGRGMVTREIYGGMVDAYASCGMFDEARRTIAEAAGRGMDCVHNYNNLLSGLYSRGNYDEVVAFYGEIPEKYRMAPTVLLRYAEALRKLAYYDRAVETATVVLCMCSTPDESTRAVMIIAYSEMCRGNAAKAYEMLNEVYERVSQQVDGGLGLRFFPRLLCGMVFACRRGGIPQPESTLRHWERLLNRIRMEERGKSYDVMGAIRQLGEIPVAPAQQ